jgi:hypothetical protein
MKQAAILDHEGELAQARVVGVEIEAGAGIVAEYPHGLDPRDALAWQQLPRPAVHEERRRARAQGVNTAVPGGIGGRRSGPLWLDQRQPQAAAIERARKGEPDETAADDDDVE